MFFFQAEDGIRDLVRSRGLGDVYKRQVLGIMLALGLPSFVETIQNMQVRTAAESILDGLQIARSEAVRRNALSLIHI